MSNHDRICRVSPAFRLSSCLELGRAFAERGTSRRARFAAVAHLRAGFPLGLEPVHFVAERGKIAKIRQL
jgi:hypothetical protein